jgi:F-type H+-transporting ATPase subunit O
MENHSLEKRNGRRGALSALIPPPTPWLHPTPKHRPKPPILLPKSHPLTTPPQYTAAAKQSALDPTARAINSLSSVMKSDSKLQTILSSPTLKDSDKSAIVTELEKHTGGADKSGTVKNFLSTLAENNRLGLLEGVCEKFASLMSASRGEMDLTITSAAVRTMALCYIRTLLFPPFQ